MPSAAQLRPVIHRRDRRDHVATATSLAARPAGVPRMGSFVRYLGLARLPLSSAECRRRVPTLCLAAQTGSADGVDSREAGACKSEP